MGLLDRPGVVSAMSPGFYFQRCLEIWRSALDGLEKEKAPSLAPVAGAGARPPVREGPVVGDLPLYRALLERQEQTFQQLRAGADGLELRLRNLAPFVTGTGQPHPLETGFAFLKPYGVPYLAGSGVKGAVRAACAAVWRDELGESEARARLKHYFGSEGKDERDKAAYRRGALVFLDLFPAPHSLDKQGWSGALRADIVNPHYVPYYQGEAVPADWHQPKPSFFLTLRADLDWRLRVVYAPRPAAPGETGAPRLHSWKQEIRPGLEAALTEQALGAKKTWGYGLFKIVDPDSCGASGGGEPSSAQAARASASAARGPSAAALALGERIRSLRDRDIKPQIDALRRDLQRCGEGERGPLLDAIEARLKQFGWRQREANDVMTRLRRPPDARGN